MICLKFSCMHAVRPDRRNATGMDVAMMSLILMRAFEKLGSSINAMTEQTRLTNEQTRFKVILQVMQLHQSYGLAQPRHRRHRRNSAL
jgi:hypothetical protein